MINDNNKRLLNNILSASRLPLLYEGESSSFNDEDLTEEVTYFDAIYSLLFRRNSSSLEINRFCDYAEVQGFNYKKLQSKSDTIWTIG